MNPEIIWAFFISCWLATVNVKQLLIGCLAEMCKFANLPGSESFGQLQRSLSVTVKSLDQSHCQSRRGKSHSRSSFFGQSMCWFQTTALWQVFCFFLFPVFLTKCSTFLWNKQHRWMYQRLWNRIFVHYWVRVCWCMCECCWYYSAHVNVNVCFPSSCLVTLLWKNSSA